ncbi:MAG: flagellar motor protein MotB [Rhodanobacter sp.]
MSEQGLPPIIVVRRGKRGKHPYHGGSWKVAYADFVTAMMAFFLVMWLLGVATHEQRAAVSEYFNNPSMTPGSATMAPPGKMGPGGASDSAIKLGGAMDMSHGPGRDKHGSNKGQVNKDNHAAANARDVAAAEKALRQRDLAQLKQLKQDLQSAIEKSQALAPFKDQLLLDITPEGLRIQIVDKLNRPMFDVGRAQLKSYTVQILRDLGSFINRVPNEISISGHTDDAPYSSKHDYSNWELSADRANAARRALLAGGLHADKVAIVTGLAAAVPLDKAHPGDPVNRRISILVMTKEAERAALSRDMSVDDLNTGRTDGIHVVTQAKPAPSARPVDAGAGAGAMALAVQTPR